MVNEEPMSHDALTQFANQKYLNLESVKKDGTPVQTPVWFAADDGVLYVYTLANTGKVTEYFSLQNALICRFEPGS